MSDFEAHDHIDPVDFKLAQKHAHVRGVDPRNSADAVWDWHDRIVAENDWADGYVRSEADANRGLATTLTRQAG